MSQQVQMKISIDKDLRDAVNKKVKEEGTSVKDIVTEFLQRYLNGQEEVQTPIANTQEEDSTPLLNRFFPEGEPERESFNWSDKRMPWDE